MRTTLDLLIIIAVLSTTVISGCVSVSIQTPKISKSKDILFVPPGEPFKSIKNETVDSAWQSTKNGNTLAFLSECSEKHDPALKTMESENLSALTNLQIISSTTAVFNDRESLETTVDGLVDGIPIRMSLLLFKKNGCSFTITYVGRQKYFDNNKNIYEVFKKEFKLP